MPSQSHWEDTGLWGDRNIFEGCLQYNTLQGQKCPRSNFALIPRSTTTLIFWSATPHYINYISPCSCLEFKITKYSYHIFMPYITYFPLIIGHLRCILPYFFFSSLFFLKALSLLQIMTESIFTVLLKAVALIFISLLIV